MVLGMVLLVGVGFAAGCGDDSTGSQEPETPPGRWEKARIDGDDPRLTEQQLARINELRSLGYVSGSRAPSGSGILRDDPKRTWAGLNLVSSDG